MIPGFCLYISLMLLCFEYFLSETLILHSVDSDTSASPIFCCRFWYIYNLSQTLRFQTHRSYWCIHWNCLWTAIPDHLKSAVIYSSYVKTQPFLQPELYTCIHLVNTLGFLNHLWVKTWVLDSDYFSVADASDVNLFQILFSIIASKQRFSNCLLQQATHSGTQFFVFTRICSLKRQFLLKYHKNPWKHNIWVKKHNVPKIVCCNKNSLSTINFTRGQGWVSAACFSDNKNKAKEGIFVFISSRVGPSVTVGPASDI